MASEWTTVPQATEDKQRRDLKEVIKLATKKVNGAPSYTVYKNSVQTEHRPKCNSKNYRILTRK